MLSDSRGILISCIVFLVFARFVIPPLFGARNTPMRISIVFNKHVTINLANELHWSISSWGFCNFEVVEKQFYEKV